MAKITFKGAVVNTNGEMPKTGSKAPDFKLVDPELKEHTLYGTKGKRIILSVNPSLDTSVCLATTKKFNDIAKHHPNITVLIITGDLPFAQKRICGLENLSNIKTLSMMRSKAFAKDYGILLQDGPLEGLPARAVLVLDDQYRVLYAELVHEITKEPDFEKAASGLEQGIPPIS